jgi:hypothetical protein
MQSRKLGLGLSLVAVAAAVALFFVLRDEGDEDDGSTSAAQTTAQQTTETDAGSDGDRGGGIPDKFDPKPKVPEIVVRNGEPVGGLAELEFDRGDRIRFVVRSDVADHVHLHGYDVFMDIEAGGKVEFDVPATIDGLFEVELEDRVVPLAEITVNPG